jgi:plastocyanin
MRLEAFSRFAVLAAIAGAFSGCGKYEPTPPTSPSSAPRASEGPQVSGNVAPQPVENPPVEQATPGPVELTITIVAASGNQAFVPNPLHAAVGNTVTWMNIDFVQHNIVLEDGTAVGNLAPGQSSAAIRLSTASTGYHCTIHPSMVGQIAPIPAEPESGGSGQTPVPNR